MGKLHRYTECSAFLLFCAQHQLSDFDIPSMPRKATNASSKRQTRAELERIVERLGGYTTYQIGSRKGQAKDLKSLRSEYRRIMQCERTSRRSKTSVSLRSDRDPARQKRIERQLKLLS